MAPIGLRYEQCPVCCSGSVRPLAEPVMMPVYCNLLWPSRDAALEAPKAAIHLGVCKECSHVYNMAFDPELIDYTTSYENSLFYSPRFVEYAHDLAAYVVERHDLRDRTIVEIGCGSGDFLRLLCEEGGNRGIGFDPGHKPSNEVKQSRAQLRFRREFYSERNAEKGADLICCRQVLEHVASPRDFLDSLKVTIDDIVNTSLFFEVPNVLLILEGMSIWDIIYEHFSYFGAGSLARLFSACGFSVENINETFDGQYLCIDARRGGRAHTTKTLENQAAAEVIRLASDFATRCESKVEGWRRRLQLMADSGTKVVVWGAGSKGVTFLNAMDARCTGERSLAFVVDANERKQGHFVAGTGQEIVPPEFMREYRPDVVIVMNPAYMSEIGRTLDDLGVRVELVQA